MKNPTREEIERSVEGLKRFDSGDRNLGKLCLRLLDEDEPPEREMAKPMSDEVLRDYERGFKAEGELRGVDACREIRRLRKDQEHWEDGWIEHEKDREAMQRCLDMPCLPPGVRRVLSARMKAGE